jgi:glucose/arabinose dehydrogenase
MKRSATISILLIVVSATIIFSRGGEEQSLSAGSAQNTKSYIPVLQTPFVPDVKPFSKGITSPGEVTNIVDPGDGRLFVALKEGRILIVNADGQIEPELLLDIRDRVFAGGFEVGLLGLAVHPNFEMNGYIYVYFNRMIDDDLYSDLARFQVLQSGTVDPQSEQNLLRLHEPYHIHQGGALQFGPNDGYLYVGTGDGGTPFDEAGFSQSFQSLHGKILRIDVDQGSPYAIPKDNPFVNEPKARGEIWVYGLRNPWRFSFDNKTGDMYIADVGDANWEEIDFIPAGSPGGQNFGWPCYEGLEFFVPDVCDSNMQYTMPVFTYAHYQDIHHCSVTGGFVYHGSQLPELEGDYIFADLCAGSIWALNRDAQSGWQSTRWTHFTQNWSSFGERSDGELFLGSINGDNIFQLTRAGTTQ